MICSACGGEITANPRADNRFRGCEACGWRMHHGCWIEALQAESLPCPYVEVEAVLWKNGKVREPAFTEVAEGHGDLWGLHGESDC